MKKVMLIVFGSIFVLLLFFWFFGEYSDYTAIIVKYDGTEYILDNVKWVHTGFSERLDSVIGRNGVTIEVPFESISRIIINQRVETGVFKKETIYECSVNIKNSVDIYIIELDRLDMFEGLDKNSVKMTIPIEYIKEVHFI